MSETTPGEDCIVAVIAPDGECLASFAGRDPLTISADWPRNARLVRVTIPATLRAALAAAQQRIAELEEELRTSREIVARYMADERERDSSRKMFLDAARQEVPRG